MAGELILVRHAQSLTNVQAVLDSRPPGSDLTDLGREQAASLAERLGTREIVAVHSSTTIRSQKTARPVAERHGLSVQSHDELLEIDCGQLDGLADTDSWVILRETFATWNSGDRSLPMPGGESWQQVARRMSAAVTRLGSETHRGDVVVVSHGGSLRILLETLLGRHLADQVGYPKNGGLVGLRVGTTGAWELVEHDAGNASPFSVLRDSAPHDAAEPTQ